MSVIILIAIRLSVTILNGIKLSNYTEWYAECHFAECHYNEGR
jgi:hypothetical protein